MALQVTFPFNVLISNGFFFSFQLRECQNQIEELSNQNKHLNKRLEKIRQSRSALSANQ